MRVLVVGVSVLAVVACAGDDRTEARLMEYSIIGPSAVRVMVDGCHANPAVTHLEQTATEVRVAVYRDRVEAWFGRSSCADSVTVELDDPLEDRSIVRATSGVAVPVARG